MKFDLSKSPLERRREARQWLQAEQRRLLPGLREMKPPRGVHFDRVTLVAYTFPEDEGDFDFIEFAVRQSWRCLGALRAVIVADRPTPVLERFRAAAADLVEIQIEPRLHRGSIASMSADMVQRLHTRFSTPYCLVVQDDGFPLRGNLDEFLGRYDYIGAPLVRDVPAQHLVDIFRIETLNGGFSLRTHRICRDAARQWKFWRHFLKEDSTYAIEDIFYGKTACLNPFYRLRNRFAPCRTARRFSLMDFDGVVDLAGSTLRPFGVHSPTTCRQFMQ